MNTELILASQTEPTEVSENRHIAPHLRQECVRILAIRPEGRTHRVAEFMRRSVPVQGVAGIARSCSEVAQSTGRRSIASPSGFHAPIVASGGRRHSYTAHERGAMGTPSQKLVAYTQTTCGVTVTCHRYPFRVRVLFYGPEGIAHVAHGNTMGEGRTHCRCGPSRRVSKTRHDWFSCENAPESHGYTMG